MNKYALILQFTYDKSKMSTTWNFLIIFVDNDTQTPSSINLWFILLIVLVVPVIVMGCVHVMCDARQIVFKMPIVKHMDYLPIRDEDAVVV